MTKVVLLSVYGGLVGESWPVSGCLGVYWLAALVIIRGLFRRVIRGVCVVGFCGSLPHSSPMGGPETKKPAIKRAKSLNLMVPGGGIEPPTRGFSILCSTD